MKALAWVLSLAYPLLVLAGLKWLDPRLLGLLVLLFVLGRIALARHRRGPAYASRALSGPRSALWRPVLVVPTLGLLVLGIVITTASNDPRALFLIPALINGVLLVTFAQSLFRPPSIVETLAQLRVADLSSAEILYCRAVTRVWCAFFVLNGGVIVWLAFRATAEQWAMYTGFVSYILIALLFVVEFVYRHYRFRRYLGSPADPILKWFFPPCEST